MAWAPDVEIPTRRVGTGARRLPVPARRRSFGPVAQVAACPCEQRVLTTPGSGTQDTNRVVLLARAGRAVHAWWCSPDIWQLQNDSTEETPATAPHKNRHG